MGEFECGGERLAAHSRGLQVDGEYQNLKSSTSMHRTVGGGGKGLVRNMRAFRVPNLQMKSKRESDRLLSVCRLVTDKYQFTGNKISK